MTQQDQHSPPSAPAYEPFGNEHEVSRQLTVQSAEDIQPIVHLLSFGQVFCRQTQKDISLLSQEIVLLTQGRAQLHFHHRQSQARLSTSVLISVPVQFGTQVYGTLCVVADKTDTRQPPLSLHFAQLLAQICGWLLYTREQAKFIQGQYQQLDYHIHGPLTKREREVLLLMSRGYDQKTIAEQLNVSPSTVHKHRQHIYYQLGVHNERDALLAAYHTGLLSLSEECL